MVCERFLDVQTSKQHGKKWQLVGGHGTTGTMVNTALTMTRTSQHQRLFANKLTGRDIGRRLLIMVTATTDQHVFACRDTDRTVSTYQHRIFSI